MNVFCSRNAVARKLSIACTALVAMCGATAAYAVDDPVVSAAPVKGKFAFQLGSTERQGCVWSDLDIIEMELKSQKLDKLIVTLEPLVGNGAVQKKEVTPGQVRKGLAVDFKTPTSQPSHWGIFICSDTQKTGKCSGKRTVAMDTLLRANVTEVREVKGRDANGKLIMGDVVTSKQPVDNSDKVYYFAYAFINNDVATVMRTGHLRTGYAELKDWITKAGAKDVDSAIAEAKKYNEILFSIQPESNGKNFAVNLPRMEKSSCTPEGVMKKIEKTTPANSVKK